MDRRKIKKDDSLEIARKNLDYALKSEVPIVRSRGGSLDKQRIKPVVLKVDRPRAETPSKFGKSFDNSTRPSSSFSPNIKNRLKYDPYKTTDFNLRLTPLPGDIENMKSSSPKGLNLSSSIMNYTTVYLTRRATLDKEALEQYSPKAKYLEEDAILHTVPYDQLAAFYEAKCVDNKHESNVNQLKYFLDRFQKMCKKRIFDFADQSLGPASAEKIADIIKNNSHFVRLNLSKNFIGDDGAKAIAEALKKNSTVIHVDLSSNNITSVGAVAIFNMLLQNRNIVSVCLNSHEGLTRNKLDYKGIKPIVDVLKKNMVLQILNLSGAYITLRGCNILASALEGNHTLFSLNISNNKLGEECASTLAKFIPRSSLEELYICNNNLGDDGAEKLLMFLKSFDSRSTIRVIDLSNNDITTNGANKIFDVLTKCFTLTKLVLDGNDFGNKGILPLGAFVAENAKISHLSMRHCRLNLEAAHVLSSGLPKNKTIENLILSWNNFTDQGIKYIATALVENDGVKKIDLSGCRIHDEGGRALAELLKKNKRIKLIDLKDNTFYDESGLNLADAIKHNKAVMKMTLDRNPMSFKYKGEVEKAIQLNKSIHNYKRYVEMERTMKDLRDFEKERHHIEAQIRVVEKKKNDALGLLKAAQDEYKRHEDEENEHFASMNKEFKDLRAEFEVLHEEDNKLEIERRKFIQDIDIIEYNITCIRKEVEPEFRRLEDQYGVLRDECDAIKNKREKELVKLKQELDKESKEEAEIEARINKRKNDINNLRERARQDLSKAFVDLKNVDSKEAIKKPGPQPAQPDMKNSSSKTIKKM